MTVRSFPARMGPLAALGTLFLAAAASAQVASPPAAPVPAASAGTYTITVPATARLSPVILPPDPKPAVHGPQILGATPRHPVLFLIPATGQAPLTYACADLPPGLTLDSKTGILSGAVGAAGTNTLHVVVSNAQGTARRTLTIVCGDHPLALTPPMGWDAGSFYADQINDTHARDAADWLVKSGLAAHGYAYIHLSDTWQGLRDKKTGEILPNRRRFPNMKELGSYLHAQGLKFGLYSSATEHTCAGYPGSAGHTAQDAAAYAAWGVDYLEYSWCPMAGLDVNRPPRDQVAAFQEMRTALNGTGRDIVYAVNTFGKGEPWTWASSVGANTWAVSPIFLDDWGSVSKNVWGIPGLKFHQQPGHWNNLGLLMVGRFGYGTLRKTQLTGAEQMSQMSQYALMSAPLWLSCDLSVIDPSTLHRSVTAMLTNDEVLDVDQDPAGNGAAPVTSSPAAQIWSKPLADGTFAVGLFNFSATAQTITLNLTALGLSGPQPVRDLWLHQDLPPAGETFSADVPSHGVALVKIGTPAPAKT